VTVAGVAVRERNLAALATRQPELADRLRARWDDGGPWAAPRSGASEAGWRASVVDSTTPVVLFGVDALLHDPPSELDAHPSLLVVVERHEARLRGLLRSVGLAPFLENGRLALVLAGDELELVEALKPFLPFLLGSAAPAVVVAPGLAADEAERYRRWGEEAARFIEFSRDPAVLNIELYQRFKPVADRINALSDGRLAILDVGGREWTFSAFLPGHRVVVADLETTGTDARALPYGDGSFDVVTGHHLLEHVAPPDRMRVVAEMVRVARRRVFVTGPFEENPFAREIDELLVRLEPDNRYLQEHARLGLPSLREIENWLTARGLRYRIEPLTRCNTWLLALALTPFQHARPGDFREVTRFYNQRFSELDRGHPAYQSLIEIEVHT
jgi:hypothetical protein